MSNYAHPASRTKTAVAQDTNYDSSAAGTVRSRTVKTVILDVQAHVAGFDAENADEVILRVNQVTVRRFTRPQAVRAGLVADTA